MKPHSSLHRLHRGRRNNENGNLIVITTSLLLVLVTLAGMTFTLSGTVGRNARTAAVRANAYAVANSALELQFAQWYSICTTGTILTPSASAFSNITLPSAAMFPNVPNFTATTGTANGTSYIISNYKITPVNALLASTSAATIVTARYPSENYIPYMGTVDVTMPGLYPVKVHLGEVFQVSYNSPWNYAIFYNGDLEINPGATMSVNGAVHSNSRLYAGAGGAQLTFLNSVDVSGTAAVNGKDPNDTDHGASGSTTSSSGETAPIFPPGFPMVDTPFQWPFGINPALLSASSSNPNATGYQELIQPPVSGTSDPFSPAGQQSQRYYNIADYVMILSGTSVTKPPTITVKKYSASGPVAVSSTIYNAIAQMAVPTTIAASNTNQTLTAGTTSFFDNREDATMETTNININNLTNAVNVTGTNPNGNNGLVIYVEDTRSATSTQEPAIRLTNGGVLPPDGLTVVSPNPVYIQGDYNTGSTTTKPATDSGTPTSSTANTTGTYWQAAAVMADAVSILSNNWSDANATSANSSLSSRTATATTVNAGIMSGNVPDSSSVNYSGGAENFPRFLESWSSVWFTYYGSMVNLYASQQATGPWSSASYNPPNRFWNYDTHFHTKPPPGTFVFPSFAKQQWFIRP